MGQVLNCDRCDPTHSTRVFTFSENLVLKLADGIDPKPEKIAKGESPDVNDRTWRDRINCIDKSHSTIYGLDEETFNQLFNQLERKLRDMDDTSISISGRRDTIVLLISLSVDLRWCVYSTANEAMYSFRYAVEAIETKVITHHNEDRKGDLVRGSYSLLDPDGRIRTVEYKVDGPKGFSAIVKYRSPPGQTAAGHLRFPNYYQRPLHLAKPVGLITKEVLQACKSYPTLTL